jgi:hypothetical protein
MHKHGTVLAGRAHMQEECTSVTTDGYMGKDTRGCTSVVMSRTIGADYHCIVVALCWIVRKYPHARAAIAWISRYGVNQANTRLAAHPQPNGYTLQER